MNFRWPWVSRRYAEYLERLVEKLQQERDQQQVRADNAFDRLYMMSGAPPISPAAVQKNDEEVAKMEELARKTREALANVDADQLEEVISEETEQVV